MIWSDDLLCPQLGSNPLGRGAAWTADCRPCSISGRGIPTVPVRCNHLLYLHNGAMHGPEHPALLGLRPHVASSLNVCMCVLCILPAAYKVWPAPDSFLGSAAPAFAPKGPLAAVASLSWQAQRQSVPAETGNTYPQSALAQTPSKYAARWEHLSALSGSASCNHRYHHHHHHHQCSAVFCNTSCFGRPRALRRFPAFTSQRVLPSPIM